MIRASQGNRKNPASVDMGAVVSNSPEKKSTSKSEQTKAINLVSVERTKARRMKLEKVRKAVKSRQTVGAAVTKQRAKNRC